MTDGRAVLGAWRPSITVRCTSVDHWQTWTWNPCLELSKPQNLGLEKTAGFANPSVNQQHASDAIILAQNGTCSLFSQTVRTRLSLSKLTWVMPARPRRSLIGTWSIAELSRWANRTLLPAIKCQATLHSVGQNKLTPYIWANYIFQD